MTQDAEIAAPAAAVVTVFRSRLRPEHAAEFFALAAQLGEEASGMPGFVSRKVFVAEDGERVTIVEFESKDTHSAWAAHPAHRAAQRLGREKFYSEYSISVCEVMRTHAFRQER